MHTDIYTHIQMQFSLYRMETRLRESLVYPRTVTCGATVEQNEMSNTYCGKCLRMWR